VLQFEPATSRASQGNANVNLSFLLKERAAVNRPVRIAQIGAGKFGTMFLSQVRLTTGMHLTGLADLMPARARERMIGVGWPREQTEAKSIADALESGATFVTDDAEAISSTPRSRW
jgi:predicted homoserine dehydrogenase-like protein